MRWKAHFFLKKKEDSDKKETFGFKTTRTAPTCNHMTEFERDLISLISNLSFSNRRCDFQKQLSQDVNKINNSSAFIVPADKTTNVYEVCRSDYIKLLNNNITTHYAKDREDTLNEINKEAREIAQNLEIDDRVETMAKKQCYITIKDHKANFKDNTKCRLINPAKSQIGKISKKYLQDINDRIRKIENLQQWRNTATVIDWFKALKNKRLIQFIQLDIVEFYPSITEELFNQAITYAESVIHIPDHVIKTIKNSCQSLLFSEGCTWRKKSGLFDITMGAYHGAEVCELVGLLILKQMRTKFDINFGLYRDDGLGVHRRMSGSEQEELKQEISKLFKSLKLEVTVDPGLRHVDFLDVTFNLAEETFEPFRKPNSSTIFVNAKSNHPPTVIKQLPKSVESRLNVISCNKEKFDAAKPIYEKALKDSGYGNIKLEFKESSDREDNSENTLNHRAEKEKRKKRKRNIIWYNPPFNKALKGDLGAQFLKLIDKHFKKRHPLHKIFNRNTVKIGYSCTVNMRALIQGHNNKILKQKHQEVQDKCNCRKRSCPLDGKCQSTACVIYKAEVKGQDGKVKNYIGCTEGDFKTRVQGHIQSFTTELKKNVTELAKFVWENDLQPEPEVKYSIIKKTTPYQPGQKSCDLCNSEKLEIAKVFKDEGYINKRNEIAQQCPHRKKHMLDAVS